MDSKFLPPIKTQLLAAGFYLYSSLKYVIEYLQRIASQDFANLQGIRNFSYNHGINHDHCIILLQSQWELHLVNLKTIKACCDLWKHKKGLRKMPACLFYLIFVTQSNVFVQCFGEDSWVIFYAKGQPIADRCPSSKRPGSYSAMRIPWIILARLLAPSHVCAFGMSGHFSVEIACIFFTNSGFFKQ